MDESIFKAYDIRGIYPSQLNEDTSYKLGRALVTYLNCKEVVVGMDVRASSKDLKEALIKGITDQGADVIDIGISSTDMFYFAVGNYGYEGGIVITASHNPKEYNGFKIVRENAIPLGGESGLEELKKLVINNSFEDKEKGEVYQKEVLADFSTKVRSFIDVSRIKPFKVVMDTGNGVGGLVVPSIFKDFPIEIIKMYFEPDGTFPNHQANPLIEENRREAVEKVISEKADLGILWDGDTDRAFFVDEKGNFLQGDFITELLSKQMLQKHGGGRILFDLRASRFVPDSIKKYGGTSKECRVGHAFFKQYMREEKAIFAGEVTGHYYYDLGGYYADNGFIPPLQILELMSISEKTLSQLLEDEGMSDYHISGEINSKVSDVKEKIEELENMYKNGDISHIDGVTIKFKNWWFNVRPSNTEPLLRLNLEADSKELMEEKRDEVLKIIRN